MPILLILLTALATLPAQPAAAADSLCTYFIVNPRQLLQNTTTVFKAVANNCGTSNITALSPEMHFLDANGTEVAAKYFQPSFLGVNASLAFHTTVFGTYPLGNYTALANMTIAYGSGVNGSARTNETFAIVNITVITNMVYNEQPEPRLVTVSSGGGSTTVYRTPVTRHVQLNVSTPEIIHNVTQSFPLSIPVRLENVGDLQVVNISVMPLFPDGWQYSSAFIAALNSTHKITRDVEVRPGLEVDPSLYLLPLGIYTNQVLYQKAYVAITVNQFIPETAKLRIIEHPPALPLYPEARGTFSLLVNNTGTELVSNINATLEGYEGCLTNVARKSGSRELMPGEISLYEMAYAAGPALMACNATLLVMADGIATQQAAMELAVKPQPDLADSIWAGLAGLADWLLDLFG
ncbi:MAG: hypothetical protein HY519_03560 [Candidatus Aenigmarchaeota archaeon]|nr:hypothetical protein [Candidatus Aenigmarchaeota archaeon]